MLIKTLHAELSANITQHGIGRAMDPPNQLGEVQLGLPVCPERRFRDASAAKQQQPNRIGPPTLPSDGNLQDNNGDVRVISGFHHTGIVVQDLDRMLRFYTEDLGLKLILELDSIAPPEGDHTGVPGARRKLVFVGFENGHQIELVHYLEPAAKEGYLDKHQLGAMHVCFNVDDLQQAYDELSSRGVRFVTEPKYRRAAGKGRIGVAYAQDPEGNWLEFIQWNVPE